MKYSFRFHIYNTAYDRYIALFGAIVNYVNEHDGRIYEFYSTISDRTVLVFDVDGLTFNQCAGLFGIVIIAITDAGGRVDGEFHSFDF